MSSSRRVDAQLMCGRHREAIAELETLTSQHPLRERFWFQRLLALYRAGRQADALRAYRELRSTLIGQLGIEPGPELRDLQARILRQDSALEYRPARQTVPPCTAARPGTRRTGKSILPIRCSESGESDIVFVPGAMSHLDLLWEDPETAELLPPSRHARPPDPVRQA